MDVRAKKHPADKRWKRPKYLCHSQFPSIVPSRSALTLLSQQQNKYARWREKAAPPPHLHLRRQKSNTLSRFELLINCKLSFSLALPCFFFSLLLLLLPSIFIPSLLFVSALFAAFPSTPATLAPTLKSAHLSCSCYYLVSITAELRPRLPHLQWTPFPFCNWDTVCVLASEMAARLGLLLRHRTLLLPSAR